MLLAWFYHRKHCVTRENIGWKSRDSRQGLLLIHDGNNHDTSSPASLDTIKKGGSRKSLDDTKEPLYQFLCLFFVPCVIFGHFSYLRERTSTFTNFLRTLTSVNSAPLEREENSQSILDGILYSLSWMHFWSKFSVFGLWENSSGTLNDWCMYKNWGRGVCM